MKALRKGITTINKSVIKLLLVKHILLNRITTKSFFIITALSALPSIVVCAVVDPYSGLYKVNSEVPSYVIINNNNNRYFAHMLYSTVELIIDETGAFTAKQKNSNIIGHFKGKQEGKYNKAFVNQSGTQLTYKRIYIPEDQFVSTLYGSEKKMSNFSSSNNGICTAAYHLEPLINVTDNPKPIDALITKIETADNYFKNIDSLLILKDNKLVVEHYFNGWQADQPHAIKSVSKSLTSLLVGTAIKEKYIKGVTEVLPALLPEYKEELVDGRENISLQDLLSMSSGLEWDEWSLPYTDPNNIVWKEFASEDSVAFVLSQPVVAKPGDLFAYSGGSVTVVGEIIRKATQQTSVSDYAKNGPLSALCFNNAYWYKQKDGRTSVAGGAYLRPRDMLKLGQLVLNEGHWNGKQLIAKEWLIKSTESVVENTYIPWTEYGYFWWLSDYYLGSKKYSAIIADGYGGQNIIIIKDLNLVVVTTATNFDLNPSLTHRMINENILPAFKHSKG
ncbi:serine hydrolase domain-containing protein [Psychromonas antarctica]|uniref:serine hydrolase domain-containing protein n=1 Tax=Psychromonas antarctica TaxID=67573 RepID=UPI001EE7D1D1|nr:serine hydrolase [Psychromonas antarctica]MCG6201982.1 beta-lactamase family protein [Psychromonas antarctica]